MKKGIVIGVILVLLAVLVFLPAGTFRFWNGWLLMAVLFLPMLVLGIYLLLKRPALLEQRLKSKETQREQNLVVKLSGLMFLVGFILAGLSYRFGWLMLPRWAQQTGKPVSGTMDRSGAG